jgi:hypothetical protein
VPAAFAAGVALLFVYWETLGSYLRDQHYQEHFLYLWCFLGIALTRTVPNAVRLGRRADTAVEQTRLARAIYWDHLVCALAMLGFLVLWLGWLGR